MKSLTAAILVILLSFSVMFLAIQNNLANQRAKAWKAKYFEAMSARAQFESYTRADWTTNNEWPYVIWTNLNNVFFLKGESNHFDIKFWNKHTTTTKPQ